MNERTDRAYARRWYTLGVLCLSLLVIVVDATIVNVALPTFSRELDASSSGLQWIVDAYTLTFAALLLLAGALLYCEFGLASSGHYQLMFATPLPLREYTPEHFPGWKAFQQLIDRVAACIGTDPEDPLAFFTAQLIWQQMHGIVSLRISRSKFPWPPLEETVATAVGRLLGPVQQ